MMRAALLYGLLIACVSCAQKHPATDPSPAAPSATAGTVGPSASNGSGQSPATPAPTPTPTPTPTPPPQPQIHLTWQPADTGQTGFVIEGSTDGVTFIQVLVVTSGTATSAVIPDPNPSQNYYVRIRAVNSAGSSGYSTVLHLAGLKTVPLTTN